MPPTVEVDSQAKAVYVRFKSGRVAKTVPTLSERMHIAVDLDDKNEVIGIEAVGVTQFSLHSLLQWAKVKVPEMDFSRAQYAPVEQVPA
jgi:uncharacterized protein YuzE